MTTITQVIQQLESKLLAADQKLAAALKPYEDLCPDDARFVPVPLELQEARQAIADYFTATRFNFDLPHRQEAAANIKKIDAERAARGVDGTQPGEATTSTDEEERRKKAEAYTVEQFNADLKDPTVEWVLAWAPILGTYVSYRLGSEYPATGWVALPSSARVFHGLDEVVKFAAALPPMCQQDLFAIRKEWAPASIYTKQFQDWALSLPRQMPIVIRIDCRES